MKKIIISMLAVLFLVGGAKVSYASDWDVAGKILTGIEGMRIITGGRFDVIGTIIGNGHHQKDYPVYKSHKRKHKSRKYAKHYSKCKERPCIPHYEWQKEIIPAHEEYDDELGKIYVEEHYIKYKVEVGGHWEKINVCH